MKADSNYVNGFATPLDRDRMLAMQHVMDDFESACYYGKGVPLSASTSRPLMKGISSLIQTNSTSSPTNAAAYKPSDLVRDTLQACFNGGGNPTILLVSTDFLSGFAVWGHAAMRLQAGSNVFGTPIDLFEAPFLSGISITPAPLLRPGTAICLSDPEVRVRLKRPMIDKPRGSRGDAFEGDIIMIGAETRIPYSRPPLSKGYLRGETRFEDQLVNPAAFYTERHINLRLGVRATAIDPGGKNVTLEGGERVPYDRLLVTTGGRNRTLSAPDADIPDIFQICTGED